jgi:hypothetical protein
MLRHPPAKAKFLVNLALAANPDATSISIAELGVTIGKSPIIQGEAQLKSLA